MFNYLEPPNAFYDFDRIYSAQQWQKKQRWISNYLAENQPDIIGFQEVFSPKSLKELVASQGYKYFAVVDKPEITDGFIYRSPVVALASRYPIVEIEAVQPNIEVAQAMGLTKDFSFSRSVLRASIDVPHLGHCDCYVVHFKSKRPLIEVDELDQAFSAEKNIIESLKAQVAGGWASSIQRGSEASLLMIEMIARRETTANPMVLIGDFNNSLSDGILSQLVTNSLRFRSAQECADYLVKYCLNDAWDLLQKVQSNDSGDIANKLQQQTEQRTATHYFGSLASVLDYILLSCEFDASYHDSLYQVSDYHVYDKHLINPVFELDGESTDHGVVMVSLTLRT